MQKQPENTIVGRVQKFFEDNPDEILTVKDALLQFGCRRDQLNTAIKTLRARGVLGTGFVIFSRSGPGKWLRN